MNVFDLKIVADSSADTFAFEGDGFACAPLKIRTDEREFVDNGALDVEEMVNYLASYKGKSASSCPSPADWLQCFGNAKCVFCITITATLSGSYNAACVAKREYEEKHPDRRVYVLNSLTAGCEMRLFVEKARELAFMTTDFDDLCAKMEDYAKTTSLLFVLEPINKLANNGRVSHLAAKAANILGIRVVGKASDRGDLEQLEKCRGEAKALSSVVRIMCEMGYKGGKVRIGNCFNANAAEKLRTALLEKYPSADIKHYQSGGLCSFYEEKGGLMIGFEH